MELYYATSQAEKLLCDKADLTHTPIGGTLELLPLCNMDCRMCYVRMSKAEMDARGRMLSCDEWMRIADEGFREGLLFLLITGGEPLLYPEFKRLYAALSRKGFVLSVNTNGTMIDEDMAAFFSEHGCRRLNITLYGKDDETYARLCGNPHGFTQVTRAAELLKARSVPFRLTCSMTPYNVDQMEQIYAVAHQLGVPLSVATHMFPAARRKHGTKGQVRLSPEEEAAADLRSFQLANPQVSMTLAAKSTLIPLMKQPKLQGPRRFTCRAANSGFWINWMGEMLPCGMFNEPRISLLEHSFRECWDYIVREAQALPRCEKCVKCPKQNVCSPCPAVAYTETGRTDGCPEFMCRVTDERIRLCMEYLKPDAERESSSITD